MKQANPLATLPLVTPGFRGLNTELADAAGFIQQDWASVLENFVFDDLGRLSSRMGYTDQTTVAITGTPDILKVHEYQKLDGTVSLVVVTSAFELWESTDDGSTWADISGDFTTNLLATAKVQLANFNDELYATAPGFKVYRYTGTGTFTEIADSQATSGNIIATFGRLWVSRDATSTIDYCGLLDGTDWSGTAAGSIDASNAWTRGTDTVTALASFGATLVVFGATHILMYVDGAGSELGVDPDNLYVVDTIEGTGTQHPDSILNIGEGDLWYISDAGVQSLSRVVQDKVNPLADISKNVRSLVDQNITNHLGSATTIQGVYSPEQKFVIYMFPETDRVLYFDTRFPLDDFTFRAGTWESLTDWYSLLRRKNGDIFIGGGDGNVHKYTSYRDGASTVITCAYASPWLNFGQEQHGTLKIPKSFYVFMYGRETLTCTARWSYDFRPLEFSNTFTNDYSPSGAEWGSGEWGSGEFGDGHRMRRAHIAAMGQGQVLKFYLTIESTDVDDKVSIQEIGVRAKFGRHV
jgi:hypothetical protein